MASSYHLIRVLVSSLPVWLARGARVQTAYNTVLKQILSNKSAEPIDDMLATSLYENGIIPSEALESQAILISTGLCKDHEAVATAIANACSLAGVELWVARSGNTTCQFDVAVIDPGKVKYIEAPQAEEVLFVRDLAPTVTVDFERRRPFRTLNIPYKKGLSKFQLAITKYLGLPSLPMPKKIQSEWGALVTDGEGLCFVGSLFQPRKIGDWLERDIKVCREVVYVQPIDLGTGHADIALATTGPGHYLVSVPSGETSSTRNLNFNNLLVKDRGKVFFLPYTDVNTGELEPSSYANALVVIGPLGTHVVLPNYNRIYTGPKDHEAARRSSKKSWEEALQSSLGIENVGITEVDASDLYKLKGSIHCATKNYPAQEPRPMATPRRMAKQARRMTKPMKPLIPTFR